MRRRDHLAIEVEDNAFEIVLIEDPLFLGRPQEQGIATDVVDLAGDALGVIVNTAEEAVAKELALVARNAQG